MGGMEVEEGVVVWCNALEAGGGGGSRWRMTKT